MELEVQIPVSVQSISIEALLSQMHHGRCDLSELWDSGAIDLNGHELLRGKHFRHYDLVFPNQNRTTWHAIYKRLSVAENEFLQRNVYYRGDSPKMAYYLQNRIERRNAERH